MKTCEPSRQISLFETDAPSMSFAAAFHAKTLATRERVLDLKALAPAYGPKSSGWFAKLNPDMLSWRTSTHYLDEEWASFSETWPRSGMMRNGSAYPLQPLADPISETGYGLLPTPDASLGHSPFSPLTMWRKLAGEARVSGAKIGSSLKWEPFAAKFLNHGWIDPRLSEWMMGFSIGHTALKPSEMPCHPKCRSLSVRLFSQT